jgi:hypothetical protein
MRVSKILAIASFIIAGGLGSLARAQYQAIPNYTGIGAGASFRNDINNHLSGVTPIAPRLVGLPFAQLPAEQDGQLYWCQDCTQTTPCSAGGTGAMALGAHGQWACEAGSGSGSPVGPAGNDLGGSYPNPSVNSVLNGKTPVTTQNGINSLAPATASYSMNGQTLTGLAAASGSGQPISYGQSGAQLSGLSLSGMPLSNLGAAAASGQALSYDQSGAQLAPSQMPALVASSTAQHSGANLTIPTPAGVAAGSDVEFAVVSYQDGGTVTSPSGWINIRIDCAGTDCQRIDYHVVGASEPSNYTWTCSSGPNQFNGGIADIRNVNTASPVDTSAGVNTVASTVSVPSLAPGSSGELALIAISGGANLYITTPPNGLKSLWSLDQAGNWGALVETFPQFNPNGIALSAQYGSAQGNTFNASEVLIKGAAGPPAAITIAGSSASVRSLRGGASDGSNTIDGYNINGVYNAVAFGATGDASADSSSAVQNAINAACAAANTVPGGTTTVPSVYLPAGQYLFLKPVVVQCSTGMRIYGDGMNATAVIQKTNALATSYGPVFVAGAASSISSMNGGTLTSNSLASGSGQSLLWHDASTPFVLDLGDVMRAQGLTPLNGLSALDIRAFMKIGAAPSGNGAFLFVSDSELDGQGCGFSAPGGAWTCNGAAKVYIDSNLALHAMFKVSGAETEVHSANNAFTVNTAHEIEAVFDGANVCLFLDGTRVATSAHSGTITQRADEDEVLGGSMEVFPMAGPTGTLNTVGPAMVDSFELRKAIPAGRTCGNTAYAMDAAKFTGDANSLLLLNFDNLLNMNGAATTTSPFLIGADRWNGIDMAPGDGPAGAGAWLAVRNLGLALGAGAEFDGLSVSGTTAILSLVNTGGRYHDLNLSGQYAAMLIADSSFNTEQADLRLSGAGGLSAYIDTNTSGVTKADNLQIDACGWACMILTGSGGTWSKTYMSPQNNTVWSIIANNFNSSFNLFNLIDPALDVENGGSAGALFISGPASVNIFGGGLTSAGTTPLITISPQSTGNIAIRGSALSVNSGTPEIVNVETPTSAFGSQGMQGTVLFDETEFGTAPPQANPPAGIPWSNQASAVQTIGNTWTLSGNTTFSGVPSFAGGLQHLVATALPNPAAPTITVIGTTGSSSYGPYYVVCHDYNGGTTYLSPSSNTVANGPAALSSSNYIQINWTGINNCASWDVLKGSATTALVTNLAGSITSFNDQGQSTSTYTPPARNTSGDVMVGTMFVSSGLTFASTPSSVTNGAHFYCPDCDPPTNPPSACTSSGAKTGAMVYGVHNQWICAY